MITGTVTVDDYVAAMHLHRQRTATIVRVWLTIFVVIGALLIATGGQHMGYIVCFAGIGGWMGELYYAYFLLFRNGRKHIAQIPEMRQPITYKWDSETFGAEDVSGKTNRPWSYYVKMKEDDKIILLYFTQNFFQMIPKRWFAEPSQLDQFHKCSRVGAMSVGSK